MTTPDGHESTAPGLRGSLIGWRGTVTVWLPAVLFATTAVWSIGAGPVPSWWYGPAILAGAALSGDPVVRAVLHLARDVEAQRRARRDAVRAPLPSTPGAEEAPQNAASGEPVGPPLRGGLVIGVLERAAVAGCLAMGYPNGVAIVVAIKGLARYGEFTSAYQREQFIIGTLASLLWAGAGAGAILLLHT